MADLGGFDDAFFLYWEDVDLSWRCREAGGRICVRNDLSIVHSVGGSQQETGKSPSYVYYNCRNRMVFAAKHLRRRTVLAWLVRSPGYAWRVVQRGGRRALIRRPLSLPWAALRGTAAGSIAALRLLVREVAMPARTRTPHRRPDSRPRVLVAHPSADVFGSDRMMLESVSGLVSAGHDVIVTLPRGGPLVDEIERRGARVRYCPAAVLRRSLLRPLGLVRLMLESSRSLVAGLRLMAAERPDIVYVSTVTLPLWLLIARLAGRPSVVHVHEAEASAHAVVRRSLATPLLLARAIVANSTYCVDVISGEYPSLRDRCEVVLNGIEGPREPPAARDALLGELRIAYLGRLSERKGVDVALEALAALRDAGLHATLDIAGSAVAGNDGVVTALHRLADAASIRGAVRFLGYRDDVWAVLADCDVLVVPSRLEEGFGNTAVEGVLAARPVVVSDTSGLREASAAFASMQRVEQGSAEGLRDALRTVIDQWPRLRALAAEDRLIALRRHDPARYRTRIAMAVASARSRPRLSRRAPGAGIVHVARRPLRATASGGNGDR